jgi:hypothetical protein
MKKRSGVLQPKKTKHAALTSARNPPKPLAFLIFGHCITIEFGVLERVLSMNSQAPLALPALPLYVLGADAPPVPFDRDQLQWLLPKTN